MEREKTRQGEAWRLGQPTGQAGLGTWCSAPTLELLKLSHPELGGGAVLLCGLHAAALGFLDFLQISWSEGYGCYSRESPVTPLTQHFQVKL
jgi:hypothetical protein